jgi:hypothetical protein
VGIPGEYPYGKRRGKDTNREIDEEYPSPTGMLQDRACENGAEYRPNQDRHRHKAHHARYMLAGATGCHHLRQWSKQTTSHALDYPE